MIRLEVNGEEYVTEQDTLAHLLKELKIVPGRVAIEVNLKVVKRNIFEHYSLKEGDSVEIVYFVGGGDKLSGKK
ncbi:MAG TPA: sulfur carrier protein ThiS [Thermodesulfovibrionales bacterium]|nr:sulfur carrier protein ThiS [Thermodesulfovibrionales bacterium]